MTRSTWKGPFYEEYLLKKADDVRKSGKTNQVIKIWTRRSTILPEFVGLTFGVYNGNKFIPVSVNEQQPRLEHHLHHQLQRLQKNQRKKNQPIINQKKKVRVKRNKWLRKIK